MREHLTLDELKRFSFGTIERLQNLRFKAVCRYLLPHTPYYKQLFKDYGIDEFKLKRVTDWHKHSLPLIKKATYMKNPRDFVVQPDKKTILKNHLHYLDNQDELMSAFGLLISPSKKEHLKDYYTPKMLIFSGGTESGNPTPVAITAKQKHDLLPNILDIIGTLVIERGKYDTSAGMNLFPYAPHLGWHAVHHALEQHTDLNLCTAAGGSMSTEQLVTMTDKFKPTIICGMSDYIRTRYLPLAKERKATLAKNVLFINGAQKMHNAERDKIKKLAKQLGAKRATVLDLYGASEFKTALLPELWPGSGYYHIAPLSTIIKTVEVEHATKDLIDEWTFSENGHAVSWNIDGAGTNLHGYFIGDHYDKVTHEKCPRTNLHVQRIYGINRIRNVQAQLELTGMVEEKVKGTRVNLAAIRAKALSLKNVKEAQVILNRKRKQVELKVATSSPASTKRKLEQHFAKAEIKPTITTTTLDKLQSKKAKFEGIKIQ